MGNTPNLNLLLTPEDDTTTTFKAWRVGMNGEDSDSNMIKIDKAYGDLNEKTDNIKAKVGVVSDKVFGEAPKTWADVQTIVRNGAAEQYFDIGDQFIVERLSTVTSSIGESTGITAATVNADTFVAGCGEVHAGEYLFTYDGKSWRNESGSIIAIAEYGIEVTGTPVAGDHVVVTETTTQLTFDVIGIDHDTPANSEYTHSMTLQLHDALSADITGSVWGMQYDNAEYTWYIDEETYPSGLAAGTYNFTLPAGYDTANGGGETYYFTTTKDLPKGGVIRFDWKANTKAADCKIETRNSSIDTSALESNISVTSGSEGTALPVLYQKVVTTNANALECSRSGSSVWATSDIRQWLNSKGEANSWWQPQNVFDRAPQYANKAGFLNGLDPEFLKVVGEVTKMTRNNQNYNNFIESSELFFLLSRIETYIESPTDKLKAYAYYSSPRSDLTDPGDGVDSNRIKYTDGVASAWSLRTPQKGWINDVGRIGTSGQGTDSGAVYASGIAPACCIV